MFLFPWKKVLFIVRWLLLDFACVPVPGLEQQAHGRDHPDRLDPRPHGHAHQVQGGPRGAGYKDNEDLEIRIMRTLKQGQ